MSEDRLDGLARQLRDGALYTHQRLDANARRAFEASSFVYALVELLNEQGVIRIQDLDERKRAVAERLAAQMREQGLGVVLQDPEQDKYAFKAEAKIDCASRLPLCRAACCRLPFALSKQDLREGRVRFDIGQPYMILHESDGYCSHLDRACFGCTIREQRPLPCRAYDCREDKRIWEDFEGRVVNPEILEEGWPRPRSADE